MVNSVIEYLSINLLIVAALPHFVGIQPANQPNVDPVIMKPKLAPYLVCMKWESEVNQAFALKMFQLDC